MMTANERRSERAFRTVLYFQKFEGDAEDIESGITDLATDLLHLAEEYGIDPSELQLRAWSHYRQESRDEEEGSDD